MAQTAPPNASMVRFDVKAIDKAADPCQDFYQYACGTWMKNNPIPADQARWGRFNELAERNRLTLRSILEKSAGEKIGDEYASCMDEKTLDSRGTGPIQPELDRIAKINGKE